MIRFITLKSTKSFCIFDLLRLYFILVGSEVIFIHNFYKMSKKERKKKVQSSNHFGFDNRQNKMILVIQHQRLSFTFPFFIFNSHLQLMLSVERGKVEVKWSGVKEGVECYAKCIIPLLLKTTCQLVYIFIYINYNKFFNKFQKHKENIPTKARRL